MELTRQSPLDVSLLSLIKTVRSTYHEKSEVCEKEHLRLRKLRGLKECNSPVYFHNSTSSDKQFILFSNIIRMAIEWSSRFNRSMVNFRDMATKYTTCQGLNSELIYFIL